MSTVNVSAEHAAGSADGDSLRERIHQHQEQLSGNELLVAQYLLETYRRPRSTR